MKYNFNEKTRLAIVNFESGHEPIEVGNIDDFNSDVTDFLYQYGVQQFLQDAAAPAKTKAAEIGEDDVELIRRRLVERKVEMLLAGKTKLERDDSGRSSYLNLAVGELYELTADEVDATLKVKTAKEIKALEASPQIAAKIAEYREAAAKAKAKKLAEAAAKSTTLPTL